MEPDERNTADRILGAFSPAAIAPDIALAGAWLVLAAGAVYIPALAASPLRIVLALPVVLFIPGYALIAALFPGKEEIDGIERLALSFGLSIAVVPLTGLLLNYTPFGIRLDPVVASLVALSLALLVVAQYRRSLLPEEKRYAVPFRGAADGIRDEFFRKEGTTLDRALSVVLLVSIVAAAGALVFVIAVPKEGERFTEFYILGAKGKAADYPSDLVVGKAGSVTVGIGNHEYRNVTYTAEIWFANASFDQETNTSAIDRMELADRFTVTLLHNSTYHGVRNFTPPGTGYNQVTFLLWNDTSPPAGTLTGMDRVNASYRDLHLWVRIREPRA